MSPWFSGWYGVEALQMAMQELRLHGVFCLVNQSIDRWLGFILMLKVFSTAIIWL